MFYFIFVVLTPLLHGGYGMVRRGTRTRATTTTIDYESYDSGAYPEYVHVNQSEHVAIVEEDIRHKRVKQTVLEVDRANYVDRLAYEYHNVHIGYGATFSLLRAQTFALDTLVKHLKEGMTALDVGCATGYLTVCMALMVGKTGRAVGIDHIPELVDKAIGYVRKDKPYLLEEGRLKFVVGDGRRGVPDQGPYDAIHIGAMSRKSWKRPEELLKQLKPGGRLIAALDLKYIWKAMYGVMVYDKKKDGTIKRFIHDGWFSTEPCEPFGDKEAQLQKKIKTTLPYFNIPQVGNFAAD